MVHGSCLCGGVEFEITGYISPIQNCHAARCRKATGGISVPELLAHRAGFRWTKGEVLVRVYAAPLLKGPPAYKRAFCETCGSPLPVELEGTPYMILNYGVIDQTAEDLEFQPVFSNQKACWHDIMDVLEPSKPELAERETQLAGE